MALRALLIFLRGFSCCLMIGATLLLADESTVLYSTKSKSVEIRLVATPDNAEISVLGELAKTSNIFEVDSPRRIVIDILYSKERLNGSGSVNIPFVNAVRVGSHSDKVRFVIEPIINSRTEIISEGTVRKVIIYAPPSRVLPTVATEAPTLAASPTSTPTVSPQPSPVLRVQPTPSLFASPSIVAPTPTATSSGTPTTLPTTLVPTTPPSLVPTTATSTPTNSPTTIAAILVATVTMSSDSPVIGGPSMLGFEFKLDGVDSVLELKLSERSQFRLVKERERRFKLSIPGIKSIPSGLRLPNFPPNEILGFTVIQAQEVESGVDVLIGVEDGKKAVAINQDNSIIVKAVSAGF